MPEDIGIYAQLMIATPGAAFGLAKTPPYAESYPVSFIASQPTAAKAGVRIIPDAGIMFLEPRPYLQNMALSEFTFPAAGTGEYVPSSAYVLTRDSANGTMMVLQSISTASTQWEMDTVAALIAGEAFFVRLGRGQTDGGAEGQGAATYACYVQVGDDTIPTASPVGGVPVRLWLQDGRAPFLQYATATPDGSGWTWADYGQNGVISTTISDSSDLFASKGRAFNVAWIPDPDRNQLIVDLAGGTDTLVLTMPNQTPDNAGSGLTYSESPGLVVNPGRLKYFGYNGSASLAIYPMRFQPTGTFTSGDVQLPFVYQGNGSITAPDASLPAGTSLTYKINPSATGQAITYTLGLSGPVDGSGLATRTPVIPTVCLWVPPTYYPPYLTSTPTILTERDMSEVDESQWIEYAPTSDGSFAMCIRTQVGIKFDNSFSGFSGGTNGRHWAVKYERGLTVSIDGNPTPATPLFPFITGWTGMKSSVYRADPTRQFDIIIEDRSWPLRRVSQRQLPPFDGWCFLSAIGYMALQGGILPAFISSDFFQCAMGPNPAGCPHFKLPVGTGQNPRVSYPPTGQYWQSMMDIAGMVHAVLYFDAGVDPAPSTLQIMPYYPGMLQTPNRGLLTTTDYPYGDPQWLMTLLQGITGETDTADRRTGVALFGLDPSTNLAQGTYLNVTDLPGTDPVTGVAWSDWIASVHGFDDPLVNVSTLNADPNFTAQTAVSALQKVTMPGFFVPFSTWFHPASYVGDQYTIAEPMTVSPSGAPLTFSIESKRSTWSALNMSGPPISTYRGRWLPTI